MIREPFTKRGDKKRKEAKTKAEENGKKPVGKKTKGRDRKEEEELVLGKDESFEEFLPGGAFILLSVSLLGERTFNHPA